MKETRSYVSIHLHCVCVFAGSGGKGGGGPREGAGAKSCCFSLKCRWSGRLLDKTQLMGPRSKAPSPVGQVNLSGFHGHSLSSRPQ